MKPVNCTVVLHDSKISQENVLYGSGIFTEIKLGLLSAEGARPLYLQEGPISARPKEISLHVTLAQRFGYTNRIRATVGLIEEAQEATADHAEFFFRDINLSRADMWRMARFLDGSVLYKDQEITFLGAKTAIARSIYMNGQEADSAVLRQPKSKSIFRSGSARFTLLIEISKEMSERWSSGHLMHENLVEGYLQDLFGRWEALKMRHHFSIVLFGRRVSRQCELSDATAETFGQYDFYHVVCQDVPSAEWHGVVQSLKQFVNEKRLMSQKTLSAKGNMLEALHLAASDVVDDLVDPLLSSTGSSIIAITAGTGFLESDHSLLKKTTNLLLGNSIGVDIVALSPKPLHAVPLFKYELGGNTEYALPHWADVSYWQPNDSHHSRWMISGQEEALHTVILPPLQTNGRFSKTPSMLNLMDDFDSTLLGKRNVLGETIDPHNLLETRIDTYGPTRPSTSAAIPLSAGAKPLYSIQRANPVDPLASITQKAASPRPKLEGTSHPLLQSSRKISVGPRGIAPVTGSASTTISTEFAQHGKEQPSSAFTPNEASSGLARQIRKQLARKPSQHSIVSQSTADDTITSKPIDIHHGAIQEGREPNDNNKVSEDVTTAFRKEASPHLSRTPKPFPSMGSLPELEAKDLAQQALTPWLTLLNPCNPRRDNMRIASQYRKWHHVFPKAIDSGEFKWDSMCSPAALPVSTDLFPTARELDKHYKKTPRRLVLSGLTSTHREARLLLNTLISVRLARGFQLVSKPTKAVTAGLEAVGGHVLMSLGTLYHELEILSDLEMQIVEYMPKTHEEILPQDIDTAPILYTPRIGAEGGKPKGSFNLSDSTVNFDWADLDQELADEGAMLQTPAVSRMRFVLLPDEVQARSEAGSGSLRSRDLSEEERRIDGIQKLTQLWQRHRIISAEDQSHHISLAKSNTPGKTIDRDPNPLAIEYLTRDPSAVVNSQETGLDGQETAAELAVPLFHESDMYHSSNFDISKLVRQMQEPPPRGVQLRDRRWFTKMHLQCFRGDEMTNWLLGVFKDVETRDDAIKTGNELMERGLFTHVRGKHDFRDGHYLYQIAGVHRTTGYPDSAGFYWKGMGKSVPVTPISESHGSPLSRPIANDASSSGKGTPTVVPVEKRQIALSQVLHCNVDPAGRSDRPETVLLHYDRIHNPENCYHVYVDWLTTTPKLIREAVSRWSSLVENHGLKLVQLPVAEASKQYLRHPFDKPRSVSLAVRPPSKAPITPHLRAYSPASRTAEDPAFYHKALLRKSGFVLDLEAASCFSSKLDVTYSTGRPDYTMTQFVHKSGQVLVQISHDGDHDFLLLENRLAMLRLASGTRKSHADAVSATAIIDDFARVCSDGKALKVAFEEARRPRGPAPSPFSAAALSIADIDVPPMQLPTRLLNKGQL